MRDFSEFTIAECDEAVRRYGLEDFDTFISQSFPRYSEADRVQILRQWDGMLSNEVRPTREHASHIARKRELDRVHFALKRVGR